MHFRRLSCLLLGAWIAGSLFMTMVATQNFRSVDRLLARPAPPAAEHLRTLGPDAARALLRYQASEQNRWYFETWEYVQLGLGVLLFLLLLFGSLETTWTLALSLFMLAAVVVARFLLTPEIIALGRLIDFVPASVPSPERSRFWVLHGAYSALELAKLGVGIVLAVKLIKRRRRKSGKPAGDVDVIDKADDRHING